MALADAIQGGTRPSQLITWKDQDGTAFPLTGATITARIKRERSGSAVNSDGTFTVTDGPNGQLLWEYGSNDVQTSGVYSVQFTATFGDAPTVAKTFIERWEIHEVI